MAVWIERFENYKDGAIERIRDLGDNCRFHRPSRSEQQMTLEALSLIRGELDAATARVCAWEFDDGEDQ